MFRAHSAHHQERQIVSIQPLVRSKMVAEMCAGWKKTSNLHTSRPPTQNVPETVLIQFISPDDEHCVLETCREL